MELPKNMMEQIQKMQDQLIEAQQALSEETVEGSAGGGAVRVTITGDQRCTEVVIDPELLKSGDAEMVQDLVMTALNSALEASRALALNRLGPLSGGMNL